MVPCAGRGDYGFLTLHGGVPLCQGDSSTQPGLIEKYLHGGLWVAIVRLRFRDTRKTASCSKRSSWIYFTGNCCEAEKKEFDDKRETLHNLISLLLTNKTICR
jgi:hypothetical protein